MNIFKQRGVLIALIILIIIVVVVWSLVGSSEGPEGPQQVSQDEPVNIVLDFYEPWLQARLSTSTDPYKQGLAEATILSPEIRENLKDSKKDIKDGIDPVLCQPVVPERLATRVVYVQDEKAEILVMSADKERTEQAVVGLTKLNDGWYISEIKCNAGEFAPDREFTFETEGFLLKSVEPPLNPEYWHIVYEIDGVLGYVAPLFFDGESICTDLKGKESACDPSKFVETDKAFIKGQMTETGVEVKNLELLKSDE